VPGPRRHPRQLSGTAAAGGVDVPTGVECRGGCAGALGGEGALSYALSLTLSRKRERGLAVRGGEYGVVLRIRTPRAREYDVGVADACRELRCSPPSP